MKQSFVDMTLNNIIDSALFLADNVEASTLLTFATIGATQVLKRIPFIVRTTLIFESQSLPIVGGILIVSGLITSIKYRKKVT